jgi:hypothetical protein
LILWQKIATLRISTQATASNPSRSRSLIELLPHRMKMSSVLTPELNADPSGKLGSFSLVMIISPFYFAFRLEGD